jgi:hypothetical protein
MPSTCLRPQTSAVRSLTNPHSDGARQATPTVRRTSRTRLWRRHRRPRPGIRRTLAAPWLLSDSCGLLPACSLAAFWLPGSHEEQSISINERRRRPSSAALGGANAGDGLYDPQQELEATPPSHEPDEEGVKPRYRVKRRQRHDGSQRRITSPRRDDEEHKTRQDTGGDAPRQAQ